MQPPSPALTLETLADKHTKLEMQLAKNNALLRAAVMIGIDRLNNKPEVKGDDLKAALQAIANSICTRPPGCYPEPPDGGGGS
ncbi:MAG: hypothetical protein MSG64_02330 [Pyrinomonadaceae bacterium MAG19_C2-C3]|nr:hypothetical protein [Pyrinomonadaceae bacterium MAG19_C2-C3]